MFGKINYSTFIVLILVSSGRGRPTQHEGETGIKEAEQIMKAVEVDLKDVEKTLEEEEKKLEGIMGSDGAKKDEVATNDAAEGQGGQPQPPGTPISGDLSKALDEIKKVEEELKVVDGDLSGVKVDFSKSDDLIKEGGKKLEDSEISEKTSHDAKHSGKDGLLEFNLVDNIITSVSNQMKNVFQCFQAYMECLKETDHQVQTCNDKLRSDESCRSGNVKIN